MDNIPPRLFETLTLPNVAARCFVVRVADAQLTPDNLPTAGTLYRDWTLPSRLHVDTWGSYVFGWPLEAPAGYSAFAFVPALPTTPVVTPRLDPIWGAVLDHTYYCLRSETQLDVADTSTAIAVLGAAYTTRHVIEVRPPREMSGEVIEVTVTTATAATVTQIDKPVDPDTGLLYTRTKTYTVALTSPVGLQLNNTGDFTSVTQERHRLFLSVTDKVTTLPGPTAPITWYGTEVYNWPKVLKGTYLHNIYDSDTIATRKVAKGVLAFPAKADYRGACLARYEEWWQKTVPTVPTPVQMVEVGISIGGVYQRIDIEPCLHEAVTYIEQNNGNDDRYEDFYLRWTYAPTNYTDWPGSVLFLDVQRMGGGFRCKRTTIYAPSASNTGGGLSFSFSS